MGHCLHCKIKPLSEKDLVEMKISAETAQILNSGQAFEVLERRPAPGGRTLVCLGGPFEADCTWVYEEFVEYV